MSEAEYRSLGPRDAMRALLQQCQTQSGPLRDNDGLIDNFMAQWVVMSKVDYDVDNARQAEWQVEAKRAFAVMLQAIKSLPAARYLGGGEEIGQRVLDEAARIYQFHGLDADTEFERFMP
ncbi:hypothetical protein GoPhGRU1p94 [Gordonia phage GRU1]|uniref:Uncharacterized protein n=1 Tax=Gordonia phage GRU1 TaxID=1109710 RepID=G8EK53_9CAUD|nr:hypothetical protein GoPhGRU1p94 [Gordonia phage GRU1]AET09935.1 hypothetical protein [Gordonia phage GRU1]WAA19640.1 hypothetical protein SEA_DALILPOP_13 [Gordonia phage Dalilpop]